MQSTRNSLWQVLIIWSLTALFLWSCSSPQPAPELRDIDGWINSGPLTLEELRGKVVLIDFWTYTCVNCIRTFPYLKEWHNKYADYGLVIIGVHTPEFEFEKDRSNVEAAARSHGLTYPIAQDNNYATWNAYGNNAWPAKYLIDQRGDVRYYHLGEGAYAQTEQMIRGLLTEARVDLKQIEPGLAPDPQYADEAFVADPGRGITRELYAGYERNRTLPSSAFATLMGETPAYMMHEEYYQKKDTQVFYRDPGEHLNHFIYLQGRWHNGPQSVAHARSTTGFEDYIAIKFYATSVNAVVSPASIPATDKHSAGGPTSSPPTESLVRVTLDGKPLTPAQAGRDIEFDRQGNSNVVVDEPRMYRLVELADFGNHELRLRVNSANFSLFTFTFGAYDQGP
jgi:thiol-disulfide isomerase/thioredoxin